MFGGHSVRVPIIKRESIGQPYLRMITIHPENLRETNSSELSYTILRGI